MCPYALAESPSNRSGVEGGLGSLWAILTSRSLAGIARRMGAGGELCHGQGANRQFAWELADVDVFQGDHNRRVNLAVRRTRSLSTRRGLLASDPVEVHSEPVELYSRNAPERSDGRLSAYESMPT